MELRDRVRGEVGGRERETVCVLHSSMFVMHNEGSCECMSV